MVLQEDMQKNTTKMVSHIVITWLTSLPHARISWQVGQRCIRVGAWEWQRNRWIFMVILESFFTEIWKWNLYGKSHILRRTSARLVSDKCFTVPVKWRRRCSHICFMSLWLTQDKTIVMKMYKICVVFFKIFRLYFHTLKCQPFPHTAITGLTILWSLLKNC